MLWRETRPRWDNRQAGSVYPAFEGELNRLSLWISGCCNASDRPTGRALYGAAQAQDGELFKPKAQEVEISAIVASLRVCSKSKDICKGTLLHADALRKGLLTKCLNDLISMYAKCGKPSVAKQLLHMHNSMDVFTWTDVIAALTHHGFGQDALFCFEQMQHQGLTLDATTFTCVLKACGSIRASDKGAKIYDEICRRGLLRKDIILGTAVVDMYAKCGALARAQQALDELPTRNVISWTSLITGYAQQNQGVQALNCYEHMLHEGLTPNAMTLVSVLKACGSIGALDTGEQILDEIATQGLLGTDVVLGTAMVDMYAKCGAFPKARKVLADLPVESAASWNALITGYVQQGLGEQALSCFEQMQQEGLKPNDVTFLCILKACGYLGATEKGEHIHDEIARQGLLGNSLVLGNALVHMYGKWGALAKAQQILEELPTTDVVSWNTLIAGYAEHGQGEQALSCLERMQGNGLFPDAVSIVCALKACSIIGLVEKAHRYFLNMSTKYGIRPNSWHYTCMVDVLGRAGFLEEAIKIIKRIPSSGTSNALWSAVLGASRTWGDKSIGKLAFKHAH
ncbi:hypothetical protein GOP47_0019150 [Adiantum capillus-veneris]|uniref:Pentatricopeptide repeat-containing protein n=1 Tax=Adiantum capillus-veneris TaxID=13818 RepID=A0A9D4UFW8_ADICA|nr:hypothetical protein GOP47_0019150 [Adiantum capillus-veneris]